MTEEGHKSEAGKWHSKKWWRGHHDARAECGEWISVDALAHGNTTCSSHSAAKKLHRRLQKEHEAASKKKQARKPTGHREQARENIRLAQHAQGLRAERYGLGYKEETAAFYGSDKVSQADSDVVEKKLRLSDADKEARAERAAYMEERAANKKKGGPLFKW